MIAAILPSGMQNDLKRDIGVVCSPGEGELEQG